MIQSGFGYVKQYYKLSQVYENYGENKHILS